MSSHPRRTLTLFVIGIGGAGGVRVTVQMANELASRGHRVRIAVPRKRWSARVRARIRRPFTWADSIRVPLVTYTDAHELEWAPGDVAIAVGSGVTPTVAELRVPGLLRLTWCHGILENQPEEMRAAWSSPLPKIAVSPTLTERLNSFGGGPLLGIVPNGIDPGEYHLDASTPRDGVGTIYREHWAKAPEFTLQVLDRLKSRHPEVPLHVFGFGRRPRSLTPAEYTRSPTVERARRLYNSTLVWLVTSRSEGFGLPILEAMACGAAVISTANLSAPGLIEHGSNGWIVPIGDDDAFLEAVSKLLADDGLRTAIVEAGFRTARQYTWERAAEALEACIARLEELPTASGEAG